MRPALVLLLLAAPLVAAPVPKSVQKAINLDGVWEVTELHSDGKPPTQHQARWTISGEAVAYETSDGKNFIAASDATFSLVRAAGEGSASVDYVVKYKRGNQMTYPGVVEVDGDTLKLCYSTAGTNVRPAACKPTEGTVMFVFKRATPKE